MSTQIPLTHCPSCDYAMDACSALRDENAVPYEGCPSVCFRCGAVLVFIADLTLRPARYNEFDPGQQAHLDQVSAGIKEWWRLHPKDKP